MFDRLVKRSVPIALSLILAACGSSATTAPTAGNLTPGAATPTAAASAATGTPGSRDAAHGNAAFTAQPGALTLVAYSTPKARLRRDHRAFQATPAARASRSSSPTAPPATRAAPSRPACRPTSSTLSLAPDIDAPGQGRPGRTTTGTANQYKGMVTDSRRRVRRPQGQPEEHQDLGRPDQARRPGHRRPTRSPRAARAGTSWPPTAPRSKQGKTAGAGHDYLNELFKNIVVAGQQRPRGAPDVRRGKGDVLLAYENEAIHAPAGRPGRRLRRARADDPDREPGRRDQDRRRPTRPRRSWTSCTRLTAQKIFATKGYRPGRSRRSRSRRLHVPDPGEPVHDRRPRRLGERRRRSSSTRRTAIVAKIEQGLGISP